MGFSRVAVFRTRLTTIPKWGGSRMKVPQCGSKHFCSNSVLALRVVRSGLLLFALAAGAQSESAQPAPSQTTPATQSPDQTAAEITSHEEATTFKVNVKLVSVRVVVRDSQGHAVGNLQKEDFQLFDNRKPQVITHFSVEQPGTQVANERRTSDANASGNPLPSVAERYIA